MMVRQRLRPLLTGVLLFVHAHSLVFFVGLLCVASNDLETPNTTIPNNLTTILPTITILSSTASSVNSTTKSTKKVKSKKSTTTLKPAISSTIATTAESVDELAETTVETFSELNSSSLTDAEATNKWSNFDIQSAKSEELQEYKHYLEQALANVTQLLGDPDKKTKRYIPLPQQRSAENTTQIDESETPADGKKQPAETTDRKVSDDDQKSAEEKFSDSGTKVVASSKELAIVREESPTEEPDKAKTTSKHKLFGVQTTHLTDTQAPPDSESDEQPQTRRSSFEPTQNHTADECKRLTQAELVTELKQKGSYNPNLMAWDVAGVFRFLDRSIVDQYERQIKSHKSSKQAVQRNAEALERILAELNLHCDVRTPDVLSRLSNLTLSEPRRTVMSPSIRMSEEEVRFKRNVLADDLLRSFNSSRSKDDLPSQSSKRQKMIGDVHVVPFGCDKRGEEEDGYLRLCGACQAIRKLPDTFFPPFINEVMCDEDRACLYFYDYRKFCISTSHLSSIFSAWKMQTKTHELCRSSQCWYGILSSLAEVQPQRARFLVNASWCLFEKLTSTQQKVHELSLLFYFVDSMSFFSKYV
ncbi:hypothetical protein M3Y97_00881000 [Aphelenchoides bicaudatus]|nr:hypothetical protein M3Y97_00881000 [Aphelenchoides bicaudatus]